MMGNLLVVDWDFFFPNPMDGGDFQEAGSKTWLYDWGHIENDYGIGPGWVTRLHDFVVNGLPLPRIQEPIGGWRTWWDRFDFMDDTTLLVSDSNGWAGLVRDDANDPFEQVWLYDAHHDAGYRKDAWPRKDNKFSCENWMLVHAEHGSELHVRYPQWKIHAFSAEPDPPIEVDRKFDDGERPPVEFSHVLLCRSGAWVPPWSDEQFMEMVEAFPADWRQVDSVDLVRDFDVEHYTEQAHELHAALEKMRVGNE